MLRIENFYFFFLLEIVCCERKYVCVVEMFWNLIFLFYMLFMDSRLCDCLDLIIE